MKRMNTKILSADSPETIQVALKILRAGGLAAFPTDTVYGVGALAFDGRAVKSIYIAKDRPLEKAIPILIGNADDLTQVASSVPDMAKKFSARFWPGPLTLIVPKLPTLPDSISATNTVAVRAPNHQIARKLLQAAGPMAVTSANISGQSNPTTAGEVFAQLGGRIALIIDGGRSPGGVPSTLVDCTGARPIILRAGPISLQELLSAS